jgi:MerR family transcriptional regulator/heat shock protein HspR
VIKMKDEPVYVISIAAKLAGMHPQTLRIYERKNLIKPKRTPGATRLYSEKDIERLKLIQKLTQEFGINLAGVSKIFELTDELEQLQALVAKLEAKLAKTKIEMVRELERVRQQYQRDLVPIPRGQIAKRVKSSFLLEAIKLSQGEQSKN